jgi:hypothetical protein
MIVFDVFIDCLQLYGVQLHEIAAIDRKLFGRLIKLIYLNHKQ